MYLQILCVFRHRAILGDGHAAANAPQDRRCFVGTKVDAGLAAHQLKNRLQHPFGFRLDMWEADPCQQIVEQLADTFDIGHEVDHGGRKGQWHGWVARRLRVLHNHRPTRVLDLHRASSAIGAGAGQNNGNQTISVDLGGAREQHID